MKEHAVIARFPTRSIVLILVLTLAAAPVLAKERTHTVEIDGHEIVVKIIEHFEDVATIRAECVIPRPQRVVWQVLTDYENLENIVPALKNSSVIGHEDGVTILQQDGHAGLWFFKRGFTVKLRVREVPMAYIGFEAFEGDFQRFKGSWQVAQREAGTWIAYSVEIKPDFYAPKWAQRRVARSLTADTIDGVIRRCLSRESPTDPDPE